MAAKKIKLLDHCVSLFSEYSRDQLYAFILSGKILVQGELCRDPSIYVPLSSSVEVKQASFVSRGGLKLAAAIQHWKPQIQDKIFVDVGSSTGGFTDCLLQNGAGRVHCIDVGYNQLDWKLRKDPRVIVHEKTNIQDVTVLDPLPHAAVADLSFRSLRGILPGILNLCSEKWMIALVKPQFEWLNPDLEFDGIVKADVLTGILDALKTDLIRENIDIVEIISCPVKGRKGNQEYLALIRPLPCPE